MKQPLDMKAIVVHSFITNEYGREHHKLDDENRYGRMVQAGDPKAVDQMLEAFTSNKEGALSSDSLTHMKYFFITAVTITIRFCIAGGMNQERAYYTSDLFISSLDKCDSIDSVLTLTREMVGFYVNHMASLHNEIHCSKTVYNCIDYIYEHMHEHLTAKDIAEFAGMSSDHLSRLFKKDIGVNLSEYIKEKKMNTAANMLLYSDFTCSDIAMYLGYNSQSYFTKVFREYYKTTPLFFRNHSHQLPFPGSRKTDKR